jgi:murein L,D-transpeptidase YcbB/YkuD
MLIQRNVHRSVYVSLAVAVALAASTPAHADDRDVLRDRIASLASDAKVDGAPIAAVRGITKLYEGRAWAPAWTDRAMVRQLHDQVRRSVEHGLTPDDFHVRQLDARLQPGDRAADPKFRAETEILCTDSLLRLAVTLKFGKIDPASLDPAWNFSRRIEGQDPVKVLDDVLKSKDLAAALEGVDPNTEFYNGLRQALVTYRGILSRGGWPKVPDGETLEPGSTGPRVVALRDRLRVTGDLEAADPSDPAVFDDALGTAVEGFQHRHGIASDGRVGPRTLEELNVPVEARIDQMRASLERSRWVFRDIGSDFIIVDIAGYHLYLVEAGKRTWSTNVQVGKPFHATPVFKSTLKYVEFNPTWTIPAGILRNETLPRTRKDPSYLRRNNMSVVTDSGRIVDPATIDWAETASKGFPYMIRQEPGTNNALGQVKFIFPNEHSVYLHDTPSKGLFAHAERAFSHGCIRTENPLDLAALLLDDQGWDRARIDDVIKSGKTTRVNLDKPVTIMLLYWTAQADTDGVVHFRKDLYGRDAAIIEGLDQPFRVDPPEGVREAVDGPPTH